MSNSAKCENWYNFFFETSLQEIQADNQLLHTLYCLRNVRKCSLCDERIDQNEKDEHEKLHELVTCIHCKEKFERRLFLSHCKECAQQPIKCDYCDCPCKPAEYPSHAANCGSRTELCITCKKHIKKLEMATHSQICQNKQFPQIKDEPSKQKKKLKRIPSSDSEAENGEQKPKRQLKKPGKKPLQREISDSDVSDYELQQVIQLSMKQT